jgi:hypothetical protein
MDNMLPRSAGDFQHFARSGQKFGHNICNGRFVPFCPIGKDFVSHAACPLAV